MAEYLLRALDIKKYFAGVKALDGVSLEIRPGEIHCLAGENGCGKSTLIKIISGVYQRDFGTIEFEGRPLQKITPLSAIESGIQVIYQDFSIFPNLSVMENLAINSQLVAKKKFVNWKDMRTIAEQTVARIGFTVDLDARLGELSVAEKQMVAICRALMFNAKLIIMDEPTTALTRKEVQALFRVILQLKEQGIAILFVSHKLDEVFEISERFTVFRSGKLTATGNTAELDNKKFTYYMTGREFEEKTFQPTGLSDEPLLEVRDLTLPGSYEDISFSLHGGEILGVTICDDDLNMIVDTAKGYLAQGADFLIFTGGMSVDPDDLTPTAIRQLGAEIITHGVPAQPGNMTLVAYLGDVPILGVPGAAISMPTTIFDVLLPQIYAGDRLTHEDLIRLGDGGLCRLCKPCHFPTCTFGRY